MKPALVIVGNLFSQGDRFLRRQLSSSKVTVIFEGDKLNECGLGTVCTIGRQRPPPAFEQSPLFSAASDGVKCPLDRAGVEAALAPFFDQIACWLRAAGGEDLPQPTSGGNSVFRIGTEGFYSQGFLGGDLDRERLPMDDRCGEVGVPVDGVR